MGPSEVSQKLLYNKGHYRGRDQPSTGQGDWERDAEEESKTTQVSFLRDKSFFLFFPCSILLFFSSALLPWCFPSFSLLMLLLMTSPCLPFLSYFFPCSQKPQQNLSNIIKITVSKKQIVSHLPFMDKHFTYCR